MATMDDAVFDAIIIGAGHAGLSMSYQLKKNLKTHVVFERGKIGESWRSQRWDSFKLNTANKVNLLPGNELQNQDPDAFATAPEFVSILESYAEEFNLPVKENTQVLSVAQQDKVPYFTVSVMKNGKMETFLSKSIVVASGAQNEKKIPEFASEISSNVKQLHTREYRNAESLPDGAVLVVGSAQSGVQVAEDLIESGRKVFLATSNVGRLRRRYRGRDSVDWLIECGFYNQKAEDVDPAMLKAKVPQVSGVGERGRTVSLQSLARAGVVVLGKIEYAKANTIFLQPNGATHVNFGDEFSKKVKAMIDAFITKNAIDAPQPENDMNDHDDPTAACASSITSLDLLKQNITSIIWTTGFGSDLSYLKNRVVNSDGSIMHRHGISDVPGLFFLGFPWLRTRKSGIIFGCAEDSLFIAGEIEKYLRGK